MTMFARRTPVVARRGVHLDLKGVPPTPARLLDLLDLFAALKLDVVLAEWEDTFPWRRYPELRSPTAYAPATIAEFHAKAAALGIEIIPLVQCFGHSENVLSKSRFRRLREIPNDVSEFCASKPGSGRVVRELVDDVLALSGPSVRRFHLGGDEAWHMGSCPACKRAVSRIGRDGVYLNHVTPILDHVRAMGVQPILWDDMMRKWPQAALRKLGAKAELMAWCYGANPVGRKKEWLNEGHLRNDRKAGVVTWGASAYKGGDGAWSDVPDIKERSANNTGWAVQAGKHRLAGVVATAWSRYNTFMAPCETIESSLDALVIAAAAMWDGKLPAEPVREAERVLGRIRGGRELRRLRACRAAAKDIAGWRKDGIRWWLDEMEHAAHRNGEPGRLNPAVQARYAASVRKGLAKGRALGDAFVRAHRGLVPDLWLGNYVASRIGPLARRAALVGAR